MSSCPNCGAEKLKRTVAEVPRTIAGHRFTADLPAIRCSKCEERYFESKDLAAFDRAVAAKLLEAGIATPDALKFLRNMTGLQGQEFAELLGVRRETVSRWEQGKRPIDRATYAVIRQLVVDHLHEKSETADYLRSLHRPKRLPRNPKLRLDAA
jgi:putative zinc finger/helix-turn-helix YgiT family protein